MELEELTSGIASVQGEVAKFDKISAGIAALEKAHPKDIACDVLTPAGMKMAIAGRAAWRAPRIEVEKTRKAAKAPVLELGRAIDTFAKELETKLLAGEANYDDQIKAEEQRKDDIRKAQMIAEAQRCARIQERIACINVPPQVAMSSSAEIEADIAQLLTQVPGSSPDYDFQEFQPQAMAAHVAALALLNSMLAAAKQREAEATRIAAEREELDRLRAEQAKRDAEERAQKIEAQRIEAAALAAERAKLAQEQAEARAAQAKLDAEAAAARRSADAAAAEVRAEANRVAAAEREAERVATEAERQRLAVEAAEVRRQQAEQEAQRRHEQAELDAKVQEQMRVAAEARTRREDASHLLLDALVLAIPFVTDAATLATCQAAVAAATGDLE